MALFVMTVAPGQLVSNAATVLVVTPVALAAAAEAGVDRPAAGGLPVRGCWRLGAVT